MEWLGKEYGDGLESQINEWLETEDGKRFFDRSVEWLISNRPEPDREQFEDR